MDDDELLGPVVPVWPDNRQAVQVFLALRTQWNCGPGGAVGLIYASLPEIWRRLKVPPSERDEVFASLRALEVAALDAMREDRP